MAGTLTYRDALTTAMHDALRVRPEAIVLGQGVTDHKGIFGTTLGLADTFGAERVIETPIAEEASTGVAIGAALNGLYPIHTHIRADFALLAMNQLVNMAAKYKYMFGGRFHVPMLVRMIIGRSWGQGAQHSQSVQSMFAHVPGLTVVMPASADAVLETYAYAVEHHRGPILSLEHRLLYDLQFEPRDPSEPVPHPLASRRVRAGYDLTIVATSIMVAEARRAATYLAEHAGIECDVIDLHCVSHPDRALIVESVARTGRLVVADTSWTAFGVAAEVCRLVAETCPSALRAPVSTIGMAPAPCPTARALEDLFYPDARTIVASAARVMGRDAEAWSEPAAHEFEPVGLRFKGPF